MAAAVDGDYADPETELLEELRDRLAGIALRADVEAERANRVTAPFDNRALAVVAGAGGGVARRPGTGGLAATAPHAALSAGAARSNVLRRAEVVQSALPAATDIAGLFDASLRLAALCATVEDVGAAQLPKLSQQLRAQREGYALAAKSFGYARPHAPADVAAAAAPGGEAADIGHFACAAHSLLDTVERARLRVAIAATAAGRGGGVPSTGDASGAAAGMAAGGGGHGLSSAARRDWVHRQSHPHGAAAAAVATAVSNVVLPVGYRGIGQPRHVPTARAPSATPAATPAPAAHAAAAADAPTAATAPAASAKRVDRGGGATPALGTPKKAGTPLPSAGVVATPRADDAGRPPIGGQSAAKPGGATATKGLFASPAAAGFGGFGAAGDTPAKPPLGGGGGGGGTPRPGTPGAAAADGDANNDKTAGGNALPAAPFGSGTLAGPGGSGDAAA